MTGLYEVIQGALGEQDYASVRLDHIYNAIDDGIEVTCISRGVGYPSVALVKGRTTDEDKSHLRRVVEAFVQSGEPAHELGKALSGQDDPAVAPYRPAFETIKKMEEGHVARIKVGNHAYLLAAITNEKIGDMLTYRAVIVMRQ